MALRRFAKKQDMFGRTVEASTDRAAELPEPDREAATSASAPRPIPPGLVPWLFPMLVLYAVLVIGLAPDTIVAVVLVLLPFAWIARTLYEITSKMDYIDLRAHDSLYALNRYYWRGRDFRPTGGDNSPPD